MTEIHFGLHSAGSGHLARNGRLRQGSTYLRNNAQRSPPNVHRPTFTLHRPTPNLHPSTHRSPLPSTPAHNAHRPPPNLQPSTLNLQPSPPRLTVISRSRRARAAPLSRLWRAWCSPSRRSAARSAATSAAAAFNSAASRRAP